MARPLKAERTVRQEIYFPASLHAELTLLLFSSAEGRVPHGAWSEFIIKCVQRALERNPHYVQS